MGLYDTECCGVKDYQGLEFHGTPLQVVKDIAEDWFEISLDGKGAFVLFTDAGWGVRAKKLAAYLRRNKLGTTTTSRTKVNPNSQNYLSVTVWAVNTPALLKWAKKHKVEINQEDENDW